MSTVDFNTLIYTASKSLKNADTVVSPTSNGDMNALLQDKMLNIVHNKGVFHQGISIKAWLFNILNKSNAGSTSYAHNDVSASSMLSQESSEVDEIHHAVKKMSDELMIPFMMHFQGFKLEEIAESLQLPIDTIKIRVQAARTFLANELTAIPA